MKKNLIWQKMCDYFVLLVPGEREGGCRTDVNIKSSQNFQKCPKVLATQFLYLK